MSQKKIIISLACLLVIGIVAAITIIGIQQQSPARIFTYGTNRVTLFDDGNFLAQLPHNVKKSGTYSEHTQGNITTVIFNIETQTYTGTISNNILTIPDEWNDSHGHNTEYRLR